MIWVHCWRGGARVKLGLLDEAMADLDLAIKTDPDDFAIIPGDVVAALRGPKAGAPDPREMRAILERGLAWAGGVRRPEHYLNSIWMRRTT